MKDDLFTELVTSVREGGAILHSNQPPSRTFSIQPPEIKDIRDSFGLTQEQFAALFGISVRTLRNW
jgi:putative transcriptional regulator